jgi:hypothetical protein
MQNTNTTPVATFAFTYTDACGPVNVYYFIDTDQNCCDIITQGLEETYTHTLAPNTNSTLEETCANAIATLRKQLCTLH